MPTTLTPQERLLRAALRQCARTWAPHPLPVDRITVHAGAPAAGRAQVYCPICSTILPRVWRLATRASASRA
jgi:hypothetical protein